MTQQVKSEILDLMAEPTDSLPLVVAKPPREKVDFAAVPYQENFTLASTTEDMGKMFADKRIHAFLDDWTETRNKAGHKSIAIRANRFAEYKMISDIMREVGFEGLLTLAAAFWQRPRWANYGRTIRDFVRNIEGIVDDLHRNKREE